MIVADVTVKGKQPSAWCCIVCIYFFYQMTSLLNHLELGNYIRDFPSTQCKDVQCVISKLYDNLPAAGNEEFVSVLFAPLNTLLLNQDDKKYESLCFLLHDAFILFSFFLLLLFTICQSCGITGSR